MVLPVTEPGFLDRFWAGFGRKATLGGIRSQTTRPWHIQNGSKSAHTATTGTKPAPKPGPGAGREQPQETVRPKKTQSSSGPQCGICLVNQIWWDLGGPGGPRNLAKIWEGPSPSPPSPSLNGLPSPPGPTRLP